MLKGNINDDQRWTAIALGIRFEPELVCSQKFTKPPRHLLRTIFLTEASSVKMRFSVLLSVTIPEFSEFFIGFIGFNPKRCIVDMHIDLPAVQTKFGKHCSLGCSAAIRISYMKFLARLFEAQIGKFP